MREPVIILEFSSEIELTTDREKSWWTDTIKKLEDHAPIANFELKSCGDKTYIRIFATGGESANIRKVALLTQRFLQETNSDKYFAATCSCSTPTNVVDYFTGLAVFVRARSIDWFNCRDWLNFKRCQYEKTAKSVA